MKPLTISDFSFTIKQPTQKVPAEPVKRPEAKDVKPSEAPVDTDKLTDEQAEKFKGLLSVDPENAQDITVEEYMNLAESLITFKEETQENYDRYRNDIALHRSLSQLQLKIDFDSSYSEKKPSSVFNELFEQATKDAQYDSYALGGLRSAESHQKVATEILNSEYLTSLQSEVMEYLKENDEQLVDEKA
ncbi:hypothetical protein [Idiomarina aminovorans]|uniref:hypothetical protein n=1 Tax=Idiomarina aminovorans TaxID=2914829 RepID=UPI002003C6EC|nr:hypothetical protein [Idiomarina sp. ATCH4]MCK7458795.1 hypothetical protein [Idiomarina sp. ATCH4]